MIVIADSSPLNYLILIGEVEVLPALYGRVLVPPAVCDELQRARASEAVRTWIAEPPVWLEVRAPSQSPDAQLAHLDAGERDAGGGRRSVGNFPSPAPSAFWRREPRADCWT